MAGYMIVTIKGVTDPARLEEYRVAARPTVEQHGGKLIVSPRTTQKPVEGTQNPGVIIFKFPSYDALEIWYNSAEYQKVKEIRLGAVDVDVVLAEASE